MVVLVVIVVVVVVVVGDKAKIKATPGGNALPCSISHHEEVRMPQ